MRKTRLRAAALAATLGFVAASAAAQEAPLPARLGGALSRAAAGADSFALPAPGLGAAEIERFFAGQRLFNTAFVKAPSAVSELAGLGPTFNRPACGACHARDGRGAPPAGPGEALMQSIVRLGPPHPAYGEQLNDRAIEGVPAEGRALIAWQESAGRYDDGTPYRLRRPVVRFERLAFGKLAPETASLRVAPQLVGMGLLNAVPMADILALAEANKANPDGVRGTARLVAAPGAAERVLGRFGWRAAEPSLRHQIAAAFIADMGLTTALHPDKNCPPVQRACRAADPGRRPNIDEAQLDAIEFYLRALAVPERRDVEKPEVRQGERLFLALGCAACHRPSLATGAHPVAALAHQTIHPFTDLLLHDMGDGLADQAREGEVSGRFWRTAPLWGLGLVPSVNGHEFYLHDGRARGLAEAILWHGGEAEAAKRRFRALARAEREALIAFLRSL
jgi:CxxC motif-containing protein (DUF1111 family)